MKKYCKNICITDYKTVYPWVLNCIRRHYKRYDFRNLLLKHGLKIEYYNYMKLSHDYSVLNDVVTKISKDACEKIKNRDLQLKPVVIREKNDVTTNKLRLIGKETAMQQIFDFIVVYSCMDIFNRRLVPQQASSIKNRGQLYGTKMIKHYINKDNRSIRYAKKHNLHYTSKCKYHVKLDAKKCYPNGKKEILLKLLEHDCANKDILWLWNELLTSHQVDVKLSNGSTIHYTGFMIGSLPSQWGMQLMLSYIYRYAMSLNTYRRGKKYKYIQHMVMFMDDMLIMGSNRKYILKSVKMIQKYAYEELGIIIKDNFSIKELEKDGIDMMGYVIYRNGKVELRARNFIRSRRLALRYKRRKNLTLNFSRRVLSFKGYYKHSNTQKVAKKLELEELFNESSKFISQYDKERNRKK